MRKKRFLRGHRKKAKQAKEVIKQRAKEYVSGEDQVVTEAPEKVTAKTVQEHREEVLEGARRFIYPLSHSKHRIAILSGVIFTIVLIAFMSLSMLLLYRYQSTNELAYRITQIIPFPVAKVDGDWVKYEEYLFELRHNMHFHTTQLNTDFESEEGKRVLISLKQESMERAKDNATVRKLADENGVSVSEEEVDSQIELIRTRGGATQSLETLQNTLAEFYGWDLNDWRRVLHMQLLRQKLTPVLDTETYQEAQDVLQQLNAGADFAALAVQHSDDELTKASGGDIGILARSNIELPAAFVEQAFSLAEGQLSGVVQTTFEVSSTGENVVALHIIKSLQRISDEEVKVAHIMFIYKNVDEFIEKRQEQGETKDYITLPQLPEAAAPAEPAPAPQ